MGREVRRVPADWQHPKDKDGNDHPMFETVYADVEAAWLAGEARWESGEDPDRAGEYADITWRAWHGSPPDPDYYMAAPYAGDCTHWQMYETCTEGTPLSPVTRSPEALARWLADTRADAFAGQTATYEQWLATILRGSSISAVMGPDGIVSGVAAGV